MTPPLVFYIDETGARHAYSTSVFQLMWVSPFGSSTWSLDTLGIVFSGFPLLSTTEALCNDQQGYLYAERTQLSSGLASIFRRPIAGTEWVRDTTGLGIGLTPLLMASNSSLGIVIAMGPQLYRRTASGWKTIPTITGISNINAVSVDGNGVIYVAGANINIADSNAVYFSTDTGATWHLAGLLGMNAQRLVSTGDTTYALTLGNRGYVITGQLPTIIVPPSPPVATSNVTVFPNPSASGFWYIQTGDDWVGSQVEVCDVTGRLVYQGTMNATTEQINGQSLAAGVYVLSIRNATKKLNGWLVK